MKKWKNGSVTKNKSILCLTPPWKVCFLCSSAWAERRGYKTAKAARNDVYRAANSLLRLAIDGRLCLCLRPPGYSCLKGKTGFCSFTFNADKMLKVMGGWIYVNLEHLFVIYRALGKSCRLARDYCSPGKSGEGGRSRRKGGGWGWRVQLRAWGGERPGCRRWWGWRRWGWGVRLSKTKE